ncbi:hypothetical protein EVAR_27753_1 [Eumeta japonica]|uniref:Uncharacterized protein n=1 Tax=Eumeta variegata TaxID=151549 RepID=A0A4C1VB07_EUMVA|nr:hypothetical protein EVAR_27753_1 [Eumeta japonica]
MRLADSPLTLRAGDDCLRPRRFLIKALLVFRHRAFHYRLLPATASHAGRHPIKFTPVYFPGSSRPVFRGHSRPRARLRASDLLAFDY